MTDTLFRILLADDDEADCLLFKEALEELKLKSIVQTVNNGVELMNYLDREDIILPNLIFLDLYMPRKSGLECLKEIRADKKFDEISIAIYSTSNAEKDREETFGNGANIYIRKPSDFKLLEKLLSRAVMTTFMHQDEELSMRDFMLSI